MSAKRTIIALAVVTTACGGGQSHGTAFDPGWYNDNGAAVAAFQRSFASTPVPVGASVAVGVADATTLIGAPLDGGATWTFHHALDARPVVAGQAVVGLGGGELFALDATTGRTLWKRLATGSLRGAGDDGRTTIVSLGTTGGKNSTVLAISRDGGVLRQIEDDTPIGVPAVVDGYAFLPWQGQYVTIYDLQSGDERARVLVRSQTSHAFTSGGAIFFGEAGATRFDDKIGGGPTNAASTVTLPSRELPGTPRWMTPGTEPPPLAALAPDRVRLYARPAAHGNAGIEGGRFAATYYRVAIGFDASQGNLTWVHAHDGDFLGGAAYEGGFALCDENGKVTLLDENTGRVAGTVDLGKKLDACIVSADGLKKAASGSPVPLAEQLAEAVLLGNEELVTIQKLLLREMTTLGDEKVTDTLIRLCSSERTAPDLVKDARNDLAARRNGASYMIAALEKHYDFLAGVLRPPPVGPLADALAAMKEKRAAPLLAQHLNDPADTPDDMQRAAAALAVLAENAELVPIGTFFASYRGVEGTEEDEAIQSAVVSSARALIKIGGTAIVESASTDAFTTAGVKARIVPLVKPAK